MINIITKQKPAFEFYKKNWIKVQSKGIYEVIYGKYPYFFLLQIIVPKGFISDGASIPRLFWPIVGGRFSDANGEASIVHDVLYFNGVDRKLSDTIFYSLMRQNGGWLITSKLKYWAVRYFGWIAYNKHRKAEEK